MDYLSWLSKTPDVCEMGGIEEYIQREKEESMRVMKRRLRKGKETDRQKAEDILGEANKMYVRGELSASIARIKDALTYNNTFDSAYYLLGVIYEEINEKEKAFNAFLIAASIKKTDITLWERLYEQKKEENDKDFQVYILKKIRRLKPSQDILQELLSIYKSQKKKEKIFEIKTELITYEGFQPDFMKQLVVHVRSLKNRSRIIEILNKELCKEKSFCKAPDEFIIGYIDVLFIEEKYALLAQIENMLKYRKRKIECVRSNIILYFSSLISGITLKCSVCNLKGGVMCTCKDNAVVDESNNHIMLANGREFAVIDMLPDLSILSDPLHLCLTKHFIDILIFMKKYLLAQKLLILVDERVQKVFPLNIKIEIEKEIEKDININDAETQTVQKNIFTDIFEVKKRIAYIYERTKQYEKSIVEYKKILSYKEKLQTTIQDVFEEAKMKISQIYERMGHIDLALEYALQIETKAHSKEKIIERGTYQFYTASNCTGARSLLYKAQHIFHSEAAQVAGEDQTYFINAVHELIQLFLHNQFIFTSVKKKKKIRKEHKKIDPEQELISIKEFEEDYILLQEINGIGSIFYSAEQEKDMHPAKKVYFDILASLLCGLSISEWIDILYKYIISLYRKNMHNACLLLLKKTLSSPILRTNTRDYSCLLWAMIKISIATEELQYLSYAINHMIPFYSRASSVNSLSLYYLVYFLISRVPSFFQSKYFFMVQKNLQRNLCRKMSKPNTEKSATLLLLAFSYMPRFIYTDTVKKLEDIIDFAGLPEIDITLDGISRAVSLSSLFLTHASSRKVFDRSTYIKKGFYLLRSHIEKLLSLDISPIESVSVQALMKNKRIVYKFILPEKKIHMYKENNHKEKLALLFYNIGRAYHQYKLNGAAEKYYLLSIKHTTDSNIHELAINNLALLGKEVEVHIK